MAFSFTTLRSEHAAVWRALKLEGVRDFPLGFLHSEAETLATPIDGAKDILNHGAMRGVFDGETLIGFCGYRPLLPERIRHRAEIGPFFVTAAYHGKGAAQVLINGVIQEAVAAGIEYLELFVDTENDPAIRFYERQGFERTAMHPDGVRIDGVSRSDYFYRLRL
ncbi:hypothetical protein ROLI_028850 [Roseobacter fucihabitans]|uniref:N-acetyltransferase domain-containing protein n=1 Tax=Roseobacter fucihabitans TaxID=1537242 RepID=A0ABZ2BUW3_9RHOB|nr:GNAT family N-acetyltransferase [Roseobacter litoralis]MBC6964803.1 Mycothiol acetyltransferase [Roseobacter litoralis]